MTDQSAFGPIEYVVVEFPGGAVTSEGFDHVQAQRMKHEEFTSDDHEQLLTPRQAAALLRVSPKTVARWAQARKIGSTLTIGGHRRYRSSEIYALLGVK